MKYTIFLLMSSVLLVAGCTSEKHVENWTDMQAMEWFNQRDWLGQTELQPDPSIDKKEFAVHYHQNKEGWNTALSFLKETDFSALKIGTYELDGRDVFAIVNEYNSKNHEDAPYEAHKEYTDIHYVNSGQEYIGRAEISSATLITPYDAERDIMFYHAENGQQLIAHSGRFFIFFPGELHSPGRKVQENIAVKKIVVKIKT